MPRPLKIGAMMFGSLTSIGGMQIFTYELLSHLAQRGHQVDLYLPRREYNNDRLFYGKLPFSVKPIFYRTWGLFSYAPLVLKTWLMCQNAIKRYDVWQIVGAYPAGCLATTLAGRVPLVLRTHGEDIQKDSALNYGIRLDPLLDRIVQHTVHRMDRLVALTHTVAQCYRDLEVDEDKIVEIPNGVDILRFDKPVADRADVRRKWGIPSGVPLVLTVGRNHPKKGFHIIPDVARILKQWGASFFWLVVGENSNHLDPMIDDNGVTGLVRTQGELGIPDVTAIDRPLELPGDELLSLYQTADIFAFPSMLEGFPRVIIEAMSARTAVVATDAPGCRELVHHQDNALVAPAGNTEEFASQLYRLVQDESLRENLQQNAHRYAHQFDWDVVVGQYEELYRSLLV